MQLNSSPHFGSLTFLHGRGYFISAIAENLLKEHSDNPDSKKGVKLYPIQNWRSSGNRLISLHDASYEPIWGALVVGEQDVECFERCFGGQGAKEDLSSPEASAYRQQLGRAVFPLMEAGRFPRISTESHSFKTEQIDQRDGLLTSDNLANPFSAIPNSTYVSDTPEVATVDHFLSDEDFETLKEYCNKTPSVACNGMSIDEREEIKHGHAYFKREDDGQFALNAERFPGQENITSDIPIKDVIGRMATRYVAAVQRLYPQLLIGTNAVDVMFLVTRYKVDEEKDALVMHGDGGKAVLSMLVDGEFTGGELRIKDDKTGIEYQQKQKPNQAVIFSDRDNEHGVAKMKGERIVVTMTVWQTKS